MNSSLQLCTLNGTFIEKVSHYRYLGIWIDDKCTFKTHRYFMSVAACFFVYFAYFPFYCRKKIEEVTFLPVLDYSDIIYYNHLLSYL